MKIGMQRNNIDFIMRSSSIQIDTQIKYGYNPKLAGTYKCLIKFSSDTRDTKYSLTKN